VFFSEHSVHCTAVVTTCSTRRSAVAETVIAPFLLHDALHATATQSIRPSVRLSVTLMSSVTTARDIKRTTISLCSNNQFTWLYDCKKSQQTLFTILPRDAYDWAYYLEKLVNFWWWSGPRHRFRIIIIARQHADARYWYSKSVRLFVRLSVTFRYQMKTAYHIVIVFFHLW